MCRLSNLGFGNGGRPVNVKTQTSSSSTDSSFLVRNEFLIRRLHSLTGLIPVGAFMTVHLLTNSSILESPAAFQKNVYTIHSLGKLLPLVEWAFIFLPLLFHGILGIAIIRGGLPNTQSYAYSSNIRYSLQRISGLIAFFFILWHVFHMHGWFHFKPWLQVVERFGGAQFAAYNASSTTGQAMQASILIPILYAIGVLACVFHLANGIWTMGITWGVWISPQAQRRANYVCAAVGLLLSVVGLGAVAGFRKVDLQEAYSVEQKLYHARVESGEIEENEHKTKKLQSPADTETPSTASISFQK
jgi:succinate dehydrogenase / fumarate reductase cytochrome b subunit